MSLLRLEDLQKLLGTNKTPLHQNLTQAKVATGFSPTLLFF